MVDLQALAQGLATKISQSQDSKIAAANVATINKVKTEVVADAVKENLNVESMDALTTDDELADILKAYVKTSDIFKSGYFYTKKDNSNGSYALLWNESDGGGSQYYNKTADMLSYVGVNDGDANGIAVQIYSKYKDGTGEGTVKNSGVRINVNPNGAYYTKGTNTSANGGDADGGREIAVKADIPDISSYLTDYATQTYAAETAASVTTAAINSNFARLWQNFDINDSTKGYFYTKKTNSDDSYALLWNESDGGGAQFYSPVKNIISFAGVNDGTDDGVCVQLYSKYKNNDGVHTSNSGVRINVNPTGAYYTKGTNTSATGGSAGNEIAVKSDIEALRQLISDLAARVTDLENNV